MAEIIGKDARMASTILKTLSNDQRSNALEQIYQNLESNKARILAANKLDLEDATAKQLSPSLIKRLDLSSNGKYEAMLQGIRDVAALEDPVGKVTMRRELDAGLVLQKITAPIGVLLVIFEARPEVIANIAALAIKSGNAAILKGGKESLHTFTEMARVVNETLAATDVPAKAIQLIETRQDVANLLDQDAYIDLVIPRGSNELVRNIKNNTKIPVLGHADGICSIYVDDSAELAKAIKIVTDAKTNYPAGCNAAETLLLSRSFAGARELLQALQQAKITLHCTDEVLAFIGEGELAIKAEQDAFDKEHLSFDLSVKFVDNTAEAISHINLHSSKHTDCIVTENKDNAEQFLKGVDSSGVYWNASTRFADGFRYGFGTEVGISTSKIHARGPVGLDGLVIYQYQVRGDGHIAGDYLGAGGNRAFIHKDL